MQQVEPTEVHGVVKSFHQTPKGDVDGLVLEDGSEVRFAPHFGEQVTAMVWRGDSVTCAVHPHVDAKGRPQRRADVVTHVGSGRVLALQEHPRHGKDGPHPDHVPHHEQMLAEIRAICAALGGHDEPAGSHGPPHERVLHALRGLRALVERQARARTE